MNDNLRHWSALSKTDPRHTKPFQRAGGFRGTATRPIWIEMRLTEHFGPCGIGWGSDAPHFELVPAGEEILVFCTLRCWYMDGETRGEVYGVGGDKAYFKDKNGLHADDEAYKKAFTDALGNAFKHVGSNADVHMGLFEDSKYKSDIAREFASSNGDDASRKPQTLLTDAEIAKVTEIKDRIKLAIEKAELPRAIDDIIKLNPRDLAFVKEKHEPTYDKLMQFANGRKAEMYGATG